MPNVKNLDSNYKFIYWENTLPPNTQITSIFNEHNLDNLESWNDIFTFFITKFWVKFQKTYKMFVFFASPSWDLDNRISRYFALWKKLNKEYPKIKILDYISKASYYSENIYVENKKIRYSGILEIEVNFCYEIFNLLIDHRSAIIFALNKDMCEAKNLDLIEKALFFNSLPEKYGMSMPKSINIILDNKGLAFYLYGSEDWGGMYLDIFSITPTYNKNQ